LNCPIKPSDHMNPWILFAIGMTSILLIVLAFAKLEFQYPPNWWLVGIGALVLFGLGLYGLRNAGGVHE